MAAAAASALEFVRALPLWTGPVEITPLSGGITNRNYLVAERGRRLVVRLGQDIPVHGILRFNEHAASRAAAAASVSPEVVHAAPGVLVIRYVEGRTLAPADVRADRDRCVALVQRAHRDVARHLRGPALSFNVFHVLRDYGRTLAEGGSRMTARLPELLQTAETLEDAAGPLALVFAHNDLLAGNFIDDGQRLWLIDWDYAGFNTPLFDLGGLSANNGFDEDADTAMLEAYFERPASDELRLRYRAMRCAALLREAMWSMVSEIQSDIEFDYVAYTAENLARFEAARRSFEETMR
jgi:thiamine kinase-like enzyme